MLNNTLIPILCARAGVPCEDSRGRITSHRGRASEVTTLASVPQGLTLHELMEWSGHSCPRSTLHYIRLRPTQLAASFVKADKISHMIGVLIDHDSQAMTETGPALYYDLGKLYTAPILSGAAVRIAWPASAVISACRKTAPGRWRWKAGPPFDAIWKR